MGQDIPETDFVPQPVRWLGANQKAIVGIIRKGAPNHNMYFAPDIALNETGDAERKPIGDTLLFLATEAERIIKLFDF